MGQALGHPPPLNHSVGQSLSTGTSATRHPQSAKAKKVGNHLYHDNIIIIECSLFSSKAPASPHVIPFSGLPSPPPPCLLLLPLALIPLPSLNPSLVTFGSHLVPFSSCPY
ncbi:hypothetical protein LZ32DRAFT_362799 [Colletotrichum eremochloae]|nr:hypothetical protein LZ32DRAFT_362799 [Colletotrichum eremochloae]